MTETPLEAMPDFVHKSHDTDPDEFIKKARKIVVDHYYGIETLNDEQPLDPSEVYIVWFSKTLGNWKALLATTRQDGQYFEVTHNGAKNEAYLDIYVKVQNVAVPD